MTMGRCPLSTPPLTPLSLYEVLQVMILRVVKEVVKPLPKVLSRRQTSTPARLRPAGSEEGSYLRRIDFCITQL